MTSPNALFIPSKSGYQEYNVLPLLSRTVSGQSSVIILLPEIKILKFFLSVTAASGTVPTLDVALEEAWDLSNGVTNFISLGTFAQKTGVTNDTFVVTTQFTRKIRANFGIGGGTPNFTFKIDAIGRT